MSCNLAIRGFCAAVLFNGVAFAKRAIVSVTEFLPENRQPVAPLHGQSIEVAILS